MNDFELLSDAEAVTALQNLLIASATGHAAENVDYRLLRGRLMKHAELAPLTPACVRTCRDLSQFWSFIKGEFGTYAERRQYLWAQMEPLHAQLEGRNSQPADDSISDGLKSFDAEGVHSVWAKALQRRRTDPEGAITAARTLLETVCKHILDAREVTYDSKADLPLLYRLASESLKLAPSQYTEDTFRKILGGVANVVNELGSLRNRLGDAHGQGRAPVKPGVRHAGLAVNLAGSIAVFLVDTSNARQ